MSAAKVVLGTIWVVAATVKIIVLDFWPSLLGFACLYAVLSLAPH